MSFHCFCIHSSERQSTFPCSSWRNERKWGNAWWESGQFDRKDEEGKWGTYPLVVVIPPGGSSLVITNSKSERAYSLKNPSIPAVVPRTCAASREQGRRSNDGPTKTEPTKTEFLWNKLVKSLMICRPLSISPLLSAVDAGTHRHDLQRETGKERPATTMSRTKLSEIRMSTYFEQMNKVSSPLTSLSCAERCGSRSWTFRSSQESTPFRSSKLPKASSRCLVRPTHSHALQRLIPNLQSQIYSVLQLSPSCRMIWLETSPLVSRSISDYVGGYRRLICAEGYRKFVLDF